MPTYKYIILFHLIHFSTLQAREFKFLNNLNRSIWVGIQGSVGKPTPENGGIELTPGQRFSTHTYDDWAGRFWARTGCNWDNQHCETGDCGNRFKCAGNGGAPPASLVEVFLDGWGGLDFYDVSLVNGFNVPTSMEPLDYAQNNEFTCGKARCNHNMNDDCPNELRLVIDGQTVGCKSACLAFNTDQYCCRGAYGTPETCNPSNWPHDYLQFFKERCPNAYSYAYDDHNSTFTCRAPAYLIVFG